MRKFYAARIWIGNIILTNKVPAMKISTGIAKAGYLKRYNGPVHPCIARNKYGIKAK